MEALILAIKREVQAMVDAVSDEVAAERRQRSDELQKLRSDLEFELNEIREATEPVVSRHCEFMQLSSRLTQVDSMKSEKSQMDSLAKWWRNSESEAGGGTLADDLQSMLAGHEAEIQKLKTSMTSVIIELASVEANLGISSSPFQRSPDRGSCRETHSPYRHSESESTIASVGLSPDSGAHLTFNSTGGSTRTSQRHGSGDAASNQKDERRTSSSSSADFDVTSITAAAHDALKTQHPKEQPCAQVRSVRWDDSQTEITLASAALGSLFEATSHPNDLEKEAGAGAEAEADLQQEPQLASCS